MCVYTKSFGLNTGKEQVAAQTGASWVCVWCLSHRGAMSPTRVLIVTQRKRTYSLEQRLPHARFEATETTRGPFVLKLQASETLHIRTYMTSSGDPTTDDKPRASKPAAEPLWPGK